jgi:hypothetical protein
MGRLRGGANNEAEAAQLTLAALNKLIAHAEWRFQRGGLNSAMRKDAYERPIWREAQREKVHGVPAPRRRSYRRKTR